MRIALAGDTMLGRGVAEALAGAPPSALVSDDIVEIARSADLFILNLECCISTHGTRRTAPGKPFFFRAPPTAVALLQHLGVDCVTLANNHALDFGPVALLDTVEYLSAGGIASTGAGIDRAAARRPARLETGGATVAVFGVTDHPADFAAARDTPGVAHADLRGGTPEWLTNDISAAEADVVVVTPHWGPNMNPEPLDYVRGAADEFVEHGAHLVAGHSAHVFQGVRLPVLYDLGDFIDDYAVDPVLRNDLGLLWLVDVGERGSMTIEAVPLKLEYCRTRRAVGEDATWIAHHFRALCEALGTKADEREGVLTVG